MEKKNNLDGTNTDGTGGTEQTSMTVQTSNTNKNNASQTNVATADNCVNNDNYAEDDACPGTFPSANFWGQDRPAFNESFAAKQNYDVVANGGQDEMGDGEEDVRSSLRGGATCASATTTTYGTGTAPEDGDSRGGTRQRRRRRSNQRRSTKNDSNRSHFRDHGTNHNNFHDDDDTNDHTRNSDLSLEWIQYYIELQQYHSLHGNCRVSTKGPFKNKPLAKWIKKQKREYGRWMIQQQQRNRSRQHHGDNENADADENENDRPSEMTEEKIRLLENVGLEWDYPDRNSSSGHRLPRHPILYGHPGDGAGVGGNNANESDGMIGNNSRSTNRRSGGPRNDYGRNNNAYNNDGGNASIVAGGNPAMNAAATIVEAEWKQRYDELVQFKNQFGHTNVPEPYQPNLALGIWVKEQRQQYKLLLRGKPSRITNVRVQLLEAIDFEWQVAETFEWKRRYRELQLFKSRFGHANVPVGYCCGGQQDRELQGSPTSTQYTQTSSTSSNSTGSLGRWVQEQREQKRLWDQGKPSSMTMERVTMLEGVGFCWDSDEKVLNEQQLRQVLRHQPPGKIAVSDHRSAYTNSKEVYSTNIAGAGSGSISRSPIKREFLSTCDPVPSHSESSSSSGGSHCRHHSQKMIPPVATTQKKSSCKKYDEDEEDGKPFHIDRTKVNEKQSPEEKNCSSDNKKKRKLQETVIGSRPQSAQKIVHSKGSPGPTQSQSSQSNVDFRITKNSLAGNATANTMPKLPPHVAQSTSMNATESVQTKNIADNSVHMNNTSQAMMGFGNTNNELPAQFMQQLHQFQTNSIQQEQHVPSIPPLNGMFNQSFNQLMQQQQPQQFNIQQSMQQTIQPLPTNQDEGSQTNTAYPQSQSNSDFNTQQSIIQNLTFPPSSDSQTEIQNLFAQIQETNMALFTNAGMQNLEFQQQQQQQQQQLQQHVPQHIHQMQQQPQHVHNHHQQQKQPQQSHQQSNNTFFGSMSNLNNFNNLLTNGFSTATVNEPEGDANANVNANCNLNFANTLQFLIASTQQHQQQNQLNLVQIHNQQNQVQQQVGFVNNFAGQSIDITQSNIQLSSSPSYIGASPMTSPIPVIHNEVATTQGVSAETASRVKSDSTSEIKARARSSTGKGEQWVRRYHELKAYKEANGHCNVPKRYADNPALGTWVSNQRSLRRIMLEGKPSHMTPDRIQLLEDLGFDWHPPVGPNAKQEEQWRQRCRELEAYKAGEQIICRLLLKFLLNRNLSTQQCALVGGS
mmetsp:Transcript_2810/g.5946  ORF Transcript_2810/g.5946 Transcript_2810/m.5946 type:complete len:1245 (-) Transcript_2810:653-4387(-)